MNEFRNKWANDLEKLIECPVCFKKPVGSIYQCMSGHHICQICRTQLLQCPTCREAWSEIRNRVAEQLVLTFEEITASLIDPENEINKLLTPQMVSTRTQTEEPYVPSSVNGATGTAHRPPVPDATKFPCSVGSCTASETHDDLKLHAEESHANIFSTIPWKDGKIEHSWTFDFKEQMIFDRVIYLPNVGIAFLKLTSDIFGQFCGILRIAYEHRLAQQHMFQLEIKCCNAHSAAYTGDILSCNTPMQAIRNKCLFISTPRMDAMLKHSRKLTCSLSVGLKAHLCGPKPKVRGKKNWRPNEQRVARREESGNEPMHRGRSAQRDPLSRSQSICSLSNEVRL